MKSDCVTTAFEIILEEIDSVVSEVNSQGANFLKNDDYTNAKALIETGTKLHDFHKKLELLKQEWISGLDEPTRRQVNIEANVATRSIASGPKAPKTGLNVKFKDGTVISGTNASEIFAKTIKKLGFQRVIDLDEKVYGFPIVSNKKSSTEYSQMAIDGYFVMTHFSNEDKQKRLLKISGALKEEIDVIIIP